MTCIFKRGTVRVPADEEPSWAEVASPIVSQTLVNWFAECSHLREVHGLELLDTSRARSLQGMFLGCESLEALDVSGFDTSQAEDLSSMFFGCSALRTLDLSGFDFSSATTMLFMFRNCSSLAALRMPGVSPERADKIRMGAMFEGTDSLGDTPQHLVELVRSGTGVSIGNL